MSDYVIIKDPLQPMTLDRALGRVREVSTIPTVALQLIQAADDPAVNLSRLTRIVENDPALGTRLLRRVNSAAYGLRTKITSVQRAVAYLGFNAVRNLAITSTVAEVFKKDIQVGPYRRIGLWRHMVSVAVAGKFIAARLGWSDFEEVFLAGLLHDVGLIVEDQYCHEHFLHVMRSLREGSALLEIEQQVIGFDHAVYGARLAEGWKFPEHIVAVIRHHHGAMTYRGAHQRMVACVALANTLCSAMGRASVGINLLTLDPELIGSLGLEVADVRVIAEDLVVELAKQDELFEVVAGDE
ncbi:MAG: HDOD domain-containing protein [Phycisphaera sp.]|nr:HDOD domain-containing protein [Phycisphaera sp.]